MVSVEEALGCIAQCVHRVGAEPVPLTEALNRVLAEDVAASQDVPRFSYATVDGFAIHRHDTSQSPTKKRGTLEVIETVSAGSPVTRTVEPGTSIHVMTGALLPPGADAVVKTEDVSPVEGKTGFIVVQKTATPMENVARAGETLKRGELVLKAGTILRPERIGVLASLGLRRVDVFRRPHIGLLGTGNEIVALEENLDPGKIYASSYYLLMAKLQERGCTPMRLGITGDDREDIQNRIRSGLAGDAMITTGGTGEGVTDWVMDIYRTMDVHPGFDGVAMSPCNSTTRYVNRVAFMDLASGPGAARGSGDRSATRSNLMNGVRLGQGISVLARSRPRSGGLTLPVTAAYMDSTGGKTNDYKGRRQTDDPGRRGAAGWTCSCWTISRWCGGAGAGRAGRR